MRLPASNQDRELANNMTPMIDVVFLLIIFFLVSSHLAKQESRIPLDLPEAASHLTDDSQIPALTVNVLADGGWQIAGGDVDPESLAKILADYRSGNGPAAMVRIRTDRAVAYERVEPLLRQSVRSGLPNVAIAVYQPTDTGRGR